MIPKRSSAALLMVGGMSAAAVLFAQPASAGSPEIPSALSHHAVSSFLDTSCDDEENGILDKHDIAEDDLDFDNFKFDFSCLAADDDYDDRDHDHDDHDDDDYDDYDEDDDDEDDDHDEDDDDEDDGTYD